MTPDIVERGGRLRRERKDDGAFGGGDGQDRGRKFGRLGAKMVKALETTPVSVRIEFTD